MPVSEFLFICKAGSSTGLGHLKRCQVLANEIELRGFTVNLWVVADTTDTSYNWQAFNAVPVKNELFELAQVNGKPGVVVVIDHYDIGGSYLSQIRNLGFKRLVVFDRKAEGNYPVDVLINLNPGFDKHHYSGRVEKDTRLLLGPQYLIVDQSVKPKGKPNTSSLNKCMVCFGGGDDRGLMKAAMDIFTKFVDTWQPVFYTTSVNPRLSINQEVANQFNLSLVLDCFPLAMAIERSDYVICSGGGLAMEAATIGRPAAIVDLADNQSAMTTLWVQTQLAQRMSKNIEEFSRQLSIYLKNPPSFDDYNTHRANVGFLDGLGASRIVDVLIND